MDLFKIANLSRVWVYAHLYAMDVPFVKVGQKVSVDLPYDPGYTIEGRVDYIFPWLDKQTRDVKARLVFNNEQGQLKPEMYASITIEADLAQRGLLVDDSAVLRSGTRNVVFVQVERGTYQPREVRLGRQLDGEIEVLAGLEAGDKVVINGQFMLDSESRLKEAIQKYELASGKPAPEAQAPGGDHHQADAGEAARGGAASMPADPAEALAKLEQRGCTYTCPMPEHFYICATEPGECQDCGMTLQPIAELKKKFPPAPGKTDGGRAHD